MNASLHSLLVIVTLILALSTPYNRRSSLLSVEARKLNSNGGSLMFTVDLIHRDSLLSPQKRQKRLSFGSVLRGHRRNLSSASYENKDIESEITPDEGGYLMKIAIGTPPVEFLGVADTGSNLIWLQCSPCQKTRSCYLQKSPLFDPTKSSTYKPISCNSQSCHHSDIVTDCAANETNKNEGECVYLVTYGSGPLSFGVLSADTFTFPLSATLPSSIFGCGFAQSGFGGFDGIIGLGLGPLSLASQLGPRINHRFSYCLAPQASGATSKLRFGGDVTSPVVVSTPLITKSSHYFLTLERISIGGRLVQVGQDAAIDSGTTLTLLPTNAYNHVRDAVKNAIRLSPIPNLDGSELCYEAHESSLNPPDVVFHFKGANVVLKAANTFRQLANIACLAMSPTKGTIIFGNVAQVNFEVGYDLLAKKVSFAPTDCTKY